MKIEQVCGHRAQESDKAEELSGRLNRWVEEWGGFLASTEALGQKSKSMPFDGRQCSEFGSLVGCAGWKRMEEGGILAEAEVT